MLSETHKTITLKVPLILLCQIWDNRETEDDLDTAIEKLLLKGLEHERVNAYGEACCMQTEKPKTTAKPKSNPANTPKPHF